LRASEAFPQLVQGQRESANWNLMRGDPIMDVVPCFQAIR